MTAGMVSASWSPLHSGKVSERTAPFEVEFWSPFQPQFSRKGESRLVTHYARVTKATSKAHRREGAANGWLALSAASGRQSALCIRRSTSPSSLTAPALSTRYLATPDGMPSDPPMVPLPLRELKRSGKAWWRREAA